MREATCCHYIDYSFQLGAMGFLYALSHRQVSIYHSRGALPVNRNKLPPSQVMSGQSVKRAHSEQAVVEHACQGHRYQPPRQKLTIYVVDDSFNFDCPCDLFKDMVLLFRFNTVVLI